MYVSWRMCYLCCYRARHQSRHQPWGIQDSHWPSSLPSTRNRTKVDATVGQQGGAHLKYHNTGIYFLLYSSDVDRADLTLNNYLGHFFRNQNRNLKQQISYTLQSKNDEISMPLLTFQTISKNSSIIINNAAFCSINRSFINACVLCYSSILS